MKFLIYILLLIALLGCSYGKEGKSNSDYARMYNSSKQSIDASFKVFHQSKDSTYIYYSVNSKSLLYSRESQASPFVARYSIAYELADPDSKLIIDSTSFMFSDLKNNFDEETEIKGVIRFATRQNKDLKLSIQINDRNRQNNRVQYLTLNQTSRFHLQNFLITSEDDYIFDKNIINSDDNITIKSTVYQPSHFFIKEYNLSKALPPPPFSNKSNLQEEFAPSKIDKVSFEGLMIKRFDHNGIYLFQEDSSDTKGFVLLKFSDNYPKITSDQSFYAPLKYITSEDEYSAIENSDNPKLSAEEFWLKISGNKEIARLAIKEFYNRVEEANTYFTTYKEGWMTDRGLILIIFGPPERVVKQFKHEIWTYGYDISSPALTFSFKLMDNKFAENVYELDRSIGYKSVWYRAQDSWRAGRPFFVR